MRLITTISLAALASASLVPAALAADLITVPTSSMPEAVPVYDEAGFDWSGFYGGLYGVAQNSPAGGTQYGPGAMLGVNAQFDFYLLGAEVAVEGLTGGTGNTSYGQILGRAGLVVTDDVVVYAAGGYGIDMGPPAEQDVLLGGGVELALAESISVRAQYLHGFPVEGGNPKDKITLGAAFHF